MPNNTLAKNHLSSLAQKGRYGDTELVHVNSKEKNMLEAMGGAGTINPKTGLKEYFPWMAAIAGASFLLSAAQSTQAGQMQSSAASSGIGAIDSSLSYLNKGLTQLEQSADDKKTLALSKFDKNLSDLSNKAGESVINLNKSIKDFIGKSNLVSAAGISEKNSSLSRRIQFGFESGQEGLIGQLGETIAGIEEFQESEKTRINLERQRLLREKGLLQEQESSWYLGKNLGF